MLNEKEILSKEVSPPQRKRLKATEVVARVSVGTLYYFALGGAFMLMQSITSAPETSLCVKGTGLVVIAVLWGCFIKAYEYLWYSPFGVTLGRKEGEQRWYISPEEMRKFVRKPPFQNRFGRFTKEDREYLYNYARVHAKRRNVEFTDSPSFVYAPLAVFILVCLKEPIANIPQPTFWEWMVIVPICAAVVSLWGLWLYFSLTAPIRKEEREQRERREKRQERKQGIFQELSEMTDEERKRRYQWLLEMQKAANNLLAHDQRFDIGDDSTVWLKQAMDEFVSDFEEYEENLQKKVQNQ